MIKSKLIHFHSKNCSAGVLSGPGPCWPTYEQGPGASGETPELWSGETYGNYMDNLWKPLEKNIWKNMWKTAKQRIGHPYLTYNQTSLKNQEIHTEQRWRMAGIHLWTQVDEGFLKIRGIFNYIYLKIMIILQSGLQLVDVGGFYTQNGRAIRNGQSAVNVILWDGLKPRTW